MEFEFSTATRIVFGPGKLRELAAAVAGFGQRALIVTGRSHERAALISDGLAPAGITSATFHLAGEPTLQDVRDGTRNARQEQCDFIIGLGGGSALDGAKAIAALLTNPGDLLDYLEVVGHGKALRNPAAPCVTIPTTAGTGAEVTRNSVLASPEHRFKVSLRSNFLLPRLALVDSQLTWALPPRLTAHTGLDTLTQLIEPYVSHRATPLTDGFCVEGLRRAARALPRAWQDGADASARDDMALASLLSGLSLANAALGAVHGFAAPLGGMFSAPHGAVCAALLAGVMEINVRVLRQRHRDHESLRRFTHIAQLLTGRSSAIPEEGVLWVRDLCRRLEVQPLKAHGVRPEHFPDLIEKAGKASSMKGNPVPLTPAELREVLELSV